ncbi:MAG TPA: DNA polymerase III subunit delta [Gemmatimonadales bacterium]
MAAQDYAEFWKALKRGPVAGAYYFVGTEDVLKDEALASLLDRVLDPSLRDFNLDSRSAYQLAPEDLATLCATVPMMAERRVVVIRDVEAWAKKSRARGAALHYLERQASETMVVLIQGSGESAPDAELAARTQTFEFGPLRQDHALRWLNRRAGTVGVALEPEAALHLLLAVDGSLGAVAAELDKLSGIAGAEPVTVAQVEALVGIRHGETQYDWRDALLGGQPGRAAGILPRVLEQPGVSGVKLLMQLGQSLLGLALARRHFDAGVRGGRLEGMILDGLRRARIWGLDYRASAKAWSDWAAAWPAARIREALRATLAADQALKTTTISDERGVLTDLILTVAMATREAA